MIYYWLNHCRKELNSAAATGRRFGEALAEGLNMVMHPLESLKSVCRRLLENSVLAVRRRQRQHYLLGYAAAVRHGEQ